MANYPEADPTRDPALYLTVIPLNPGCTFEATHAGSVMHTSLGLPSLQSVLLDICCSPSLLSKSTTYM